MRTKTNKLLTSILVVLSVIFMSLGVIIAKPATNFGASAEETASVLQMDEGAAIRTEDHYGLKYTARISDADYQDLILNYGKENITFGMLIAPATFAELTEANVFGDSAKFAWAMYDEAEHAWAPYEAIAGKQQIINIYGQNVKQATDGSWSFEGSVTNLKESSLISSFQGRGYIEIDLGAGNKDYIFADTNNNVVTPYAVASKLVHLSDSITHFTVEQKQYIRTNYVEFVKNNLLNVSDLGLVKADTINLSNAALQAYPQSGAKLSLPAVDSLESIVLERYIYGSNLASYTNEFKSLYTVDTTDILSNDWSLDISGLAEGMYKLTAAINGIAGYEVYFEKYVENVFTWNNLTAEQDANAYGIKLINPYRADPYKNNDVTVSVADNPLGREGSYYKVTGLNSSVRYFAVGIYPVHSKAYYQMFYTEDTNPMFIMDVGVENADTGAKGSSIQSYEYYGYASKLGASNTGKVTKSTTNGWASTQKASFKTLIENYWDDYALSAVKGSFVGEWDSVPFTNTAVYVGNFRLVNVAYTQEHYFETGIATGEFEKREGFADEVLTAGFGATVEFTPATEIGNFTYDAENVNGVVSGVNNGSLVLKGYYTANKTYLEHTLSGLRTDAIHELSSLSGEIVDVKVTQYVIRTGTSSVTLDGVKYGASAFGVTSLYSENVKSDNGIIYIDTTGLDGIFKFTVESTTGTEVITFEQKTDAFVWNNLSVDTSGYSIKLTNGWESDAYNTSKGAVTKTVVDSALGRTGTYFRIDSVTSSNRDSIGIGVSPTHSKAYYQSFYAEDETAKFIFDVGVANAADETKVLNGVDKTLKGTEYYNKTFISSHPERTFTNGWMSSAAISFKTLIESYWSDFAQNSNKGAFYGSFKGVPYTKTVIYIGNFRLSTVTADYVEEVYTETAIGSGEYVKNDALTSTKSAEYGAWIKSTPATLEGYEFDAENANNVLAGENNGSLVLKIYYKQPKTTVTETLMGIQSGSTIALSNCAGEIQNVTVTQYVVRNDGDVTLTLSEGVSTKVKGVDVTGLYSANVKSDNGYYIDTTGLDGIFTFAVETTGGNHEVTFEQEVAGTFTWNNLKDLASVYVSSGSGITLSVATDDEVADLLTKHNASMFANEESTLFKFYASTAVERFTLKVFPVHTKAYYEAWITANPNAKVVLPLYVCKADNYNQFFNVNYNNADSSYRYTTNRCGDGESGWGGLSGTTKANGAAYKYPRNQVALSLFTGTNYDSLIQTTGNAYIATKTGTAMADTNDGSATFYFGSIFISSLS